MCGIFGFVGRGADASTLTAVASLAAERGPDGYGIASISRGDVNVMYGEGSLDDSLVVVRSLTNADAMLGHCRLPTQGGRDAKHPFRCGRGWLVHNGNVYDFRKYGHAISSSCDSEMLAAEVAVAGSFQSDRLIDTAVKMHGNVPFAVAYIDDEIVSIARSGHPLYVSERRSPVYFASKYFPGSSMLASHATFQITGD